MFLQILHSGVTAFCSTKASVAEVGTVSALKWLTDQEFDVSTFTLRKEKLVQVVYWNNYSAIDCTQLVQFQLVSSFFFNMSHIYIEQLEAQEISGGEKTRK